MAVSFVASSQNTGAGVTNTGAVTTPAFTLPTGTAAGDRVFIATASVGAPTAPSGWTQLFNAQVGGGTMAASAGLRYAMVCFRDYDGVWTMPTVTAASVAANTIVGAAYTVRKGAGEVFGTATVTAGNDTTADTAASATGSSRTLVTGGRLWSVLVAPASVGTQTNPQLTSTAGTLTFNVTAPVAVSNTTGNDATIIGRDYAVATGGTGTQTYTATLQTARTLGALFVHQGASVVAVTVTGSGALTAAPATVSGAGGSLSAGSGTTTASTASLSGVATSTLTGAGSLAAGTPTASGTATVASPAVTGLGALAASPVALSGVGTSRATGAGALAASSDALAGAGTSRLTAVGALTSTAAGLSGSGTSTSSGTGTLATAATLAGAGTVRQSGTGAVATSASSLSGAGAVALVGTGALAASPVTASGAGTSRAAGGGALTATGPTVTGAAVIGQPAATIDGAGLITAASASLSGVGALAVVGAATLNAQAATAAGAALLAIAGSGTLTAARATVTGSTAPPPRRRNVAVRISAGRSTALNARSGASQTITATPRE